MIPVHRQDYLLKLLDRQGVVSINDLTERLAVSHMTVRRDIAQLEAQGLVMSVSGGVRRAAGFRHEPPWQEKAGANLLQKRAIAQRAVADIHDGMSIYLDAGTTTYEMARLLSGHQRLSVITNNFHISNLLAQHSHIELFHTGGRVNPDNHSTVGPAVVEFLRHINVDIAFLSSSSWHLERGVTTPDDAKIMIKQQLLQTASKRILVADSTKYGRTGMFRACTLEDFDLIVTDSGLAESALEAIRERNINIDAVAASPLHSVETSQKQP
ncbi:DeoR/GlpR family DNA-binding transcription regulator [Kushneria sp. AK178]